MHQNAGDAEALAVYTVAASLAPQQKGEADELFACVSYLLVLVRVSSDTPPSRRLQAEHPNHPLVADLAAKASIFDEFAAKFDVPPVAAAA